MLRLTQRQVLADDGLASRLIHRFAALHDGFRRDIARSPRDRSIPHMDIATVVVGGGGRELPASALSRCRRRLGTLRFLRASCGVRVGRIALFAGIRAFLGEPLIDA